jgi:apolipoprotein D and lipocalin family protein
MRNTNKALVGAAAVATSGLAALVASRLLARHPQGNAKVPEPAKSVDLQRYLGHWYEIARYDQRFERGCEAATADYALRPDGRIDVLNRCRKRNADVKQARGVARVVDAATNAKLKVRFFGPFQGDYWVLDRADDYSWSIVGEPSGRYLWILARDPHPAGEEVERLVARAAELGYDTSMLVFDQH